MPMPFDLLFWNADSTRMAAANHAFYLRNCYLRNALTAGEMILDGKTLSLKDVKIPIYNLATREDHIAPAKSVFLGSQFFGGKVDFVLAGSGHIAGVVNPPDKNKYQYLDRRPRQGRIRRLARQGRGNPRFLVAALAGLDRSEGRQDASLRANPAARHSTPSRKPPAAMSWSGHSVRRSFRRKSVYSKMIKVAGDGGSSFVTMVPNPARRPISDNSLFVIGIALRRRRQHHPGECGRKIREKRGHRSARTRRRRPCPRHRDWREPSSGDQRRFRYRNGGGSSAAE